MPLLCINTPAPYSRIFPGHNPTASASGSTGRVFPPSLAESLWDALPPPAALAALAPDITPCNNMPASLPTRSPAEVPSGCSPGRMPDGAAALPLLCNLIYSLQSLPLCSSKCQCRCQFAGGKHPRKISNSFLSFSLHCFARLHGVSHLKYSFRLLSALSQCSHGLFIPLLHLFNLPQTP